jgi:hypothetical protein
VRYVPESTLQELWLVFDSLRYMPTVDVIIRIWSIYPFFLDIIDDEFEVWRYVVGLNGTQVKSFHRSTWVLVGHFPELVFVDFRGRWKLC